VRKKRDSAEWCNARSDTVDIDKVSKVHASELRVLVPRESTVRHGWLEVRLLDDLGKLDRLSWLDLLSKAGAVEKSCCQGQEPLQVATHVEALVSR
jgi:hypothetical protein